MKALPLPAENPKNAFASMVDVAFLLLIFFLVATTLRSPERDLEMVIPRRGVAEAPVISPLVLELRDDASVWWGDGAGAFEAAGAADGRELERLRCLLDGEVSATGAGNFSVILRVGDGASQQRFVDVVNALAGSGIRQVALAD